MGGSNDFFEKPKNVGDFSNPTTRFALPIIEENFKDAVKILKSKFPLSKVVLVTILPKVDFSKYNDKVQYINKKIEKIRGDYNINMFNVMRLFMTRRRHVHRGKFHTDKVHLTRKPSQENPVKARERQQPPWGQEELAEALSKCSSFLHRHSQGWTALDCGAEVVWDC